MGCKYLAEDNNEQLGTRWEKALEKESFGLALKGSNWTSRDKRPVLRGDPQCVQMGNNIGANKTDRLDTGRYFFDFYQKITLFDYVPILKQSTLNGSVCDHFKSIVVKK